MKKEYSHNYLADEQDNIGEFTPKLMDLVTIKENSRNKKEELSLGDKKNPVKVY